MAQGVKEEFNVPEGVELKLTGDTVEVSGPRGKLKRMFNFKTVTLKSEGQKILIETESTRRKDKSAVGTIKSHLRNMCKGVTDGFTYKLRTVYAHFPITVKVEEKRVLISNFLGERSPRVADIIGDASVEVKGDEMTVKGMNKDDVGQTAFNIEQATFVRYRDSRTFQDGCYIVERA